ncbi:MAG: hypothetical protein ABIJ33_04545 [Patescibacteria group bacterium]
MSEFEITIEIPGSAYGEIIIIEKYHDQYGLVLGKKGDKGSTVFKKWCFPEWKKEPGKKAVPWKIPLGNVTDTIEVIKQIAGAFGLTVSTPKIGSQNQQLDDDIPF